MSRLSRRAVAVVLAVVLGSAGLPACSSDPLPAGWERSEVGSLSVAHPDGWVALDDTALGERLVWRSGLQDAAGDTATVQLLLAPVLDGDFRSAAEASGVLAAGAQLGVPFEGWASQGRQDVEVDGATTAQRWDFRYQGEDGAVDGVWVVVTDEESRVSAAVQLTGDPLDEQLVFDVVRSIRFDASLAQPDQGEAGTAG